MKQRPFLFRNIYERLVLSREEQYKQRTNEEFLALMMEMISHSLFAGLMTTIIGAVLGFTAFGGMFLDIYNNIAPPDEVSGEVTILTIGPEALYLWDSKNPDPEVTPRAMLGELISILDEAGARTIVLDVLLYSEEEGDARLLEAAKAHGGVIGAEKFMVDQPRTGRLFARGINPTLQGANGPVYSAQANLFFTEPIFFTGDKIFRGVHLVKHYQRSTISGQWPNTIVGAREEVFSPSLSLAGAWYHRARAENPDVKFSELLFELQENCSVEEGGFSCNTDRLSHLDPFNTNLHEPFWLHHLGSERNDKLAFVSASTLLMLTAERETFRRLGIPKEQLPPVAFPKDVVGKLKDKLVIVGRVDRMGEKTADRHPTSYSFPIFKNKDMAGVRIQAQLMEALLTGRHVRQVSIWFEWILGASMVGIMIMLYKKYPLVWHIPIFVLLVAVLMGLGLFLFIGFDGLVLELGIPITSAIYCMIWLHTRYAWKLMGVGKKRDINSVLEPDIAQDTEEHAEKEADLEGNSDLKEDISKPNEVG